MSITLRFTEIEIYIPVFTEIKIYMYVPVFTEIKIYM